MAENPQTPLNDAPTAKSGKGYSGKLIASPPKDLAGQMIAELRDWVEKGQ